jgi:hypothetical protein
MIPKPIQIRVRIYSPLITELSKLKSVQVMLVITLVTHSSMSAERKSSRMPMPSHRSVTEWGTDSSDDDIERVPVQKARMLQIGDEHEVEEFYKARFEDL